MSDSIQEILDRLVVQNGPFKGMQYPAATAIGSTLPPKILGSYEREIQPHILKMAENPKAYETILNIGCGEGYYSVGLAMLFPEAKSFAFDNNEEAISLCQANAELNGVSVAVGGFCDKQIMVRLAKGKKALIFCDCESYEKELFDEDVAQELVSSDLIIETHDFMDIGITKAMTDAFKDTHDCTLVESVDDTIKAYTYDYPELADLGLWERRCILEERRPSIMRWLIAKSKAA